MAFADLIRTANGTREDVADLLEKLLIIGEQNTSGVISTSSATLATMGSMSHSLTIVSGVWVVNMLYVSISGQTADKQSTIEIQENGTALVSQVWSSSDVSTDGRDELVTLFHLQKTPVNGTTTYRAQWKSNDGATIFDSSSGRLITLAFRAS